MNAMFVRAVCVMAVLQAGAMAQVGWTQVATTGPSGRGGAAMAYDSQRGKTVLFGGQVPLGAAQADTWEWSGTSWTLAATTGPSPRSGSAMAYDSLRGRTVLFGGGDGASVTLGDTWEWDGSNWLQVAATVPLPSSSGPTPLQFPAMAYDSQRHRCVLVGYFTINSARYYQAWEWNGSTWSQVPSPGPFVGRMAYDSQRGRTVLSSQGSMWEWDGISWTQVTSPGGPSNAGPVVYDSRRRRTVLYSPSIFGRPETWIWDGTSWTLVATTNSPLALYSGQVEMAYDSQRGRTVLVVMASGETWELTLPISGEFTTFGQGCPGPAGAPQLSALPGSRPVIGQTFQMQLTNLPISIFALPVGAAGFSNQTFNGVSLPAPMDAIGAPGCTLQVSIDQEFVLSNQSGTASWNVPVPFDLNLLGLDAYLQGAVLVPGFNAANLVVANAGHAVIGSL